MIMAQSTNPHQQKEWLQKKTTYGLEMFHVSDLNPSNKTIKSQGEMCTGDSVL